MGSVDERDVVVINSSKDYIDDAQVVIVSYEILCKRKVELKNNSYKIVILVSSFIYLFFSIYLGKFIFTFLTNRKNKQIFIS